MSVLSKSKPLRRIREPFGKAGLTVAILALVFAMVGGAFAAGKLTATQKREVTKIAKKFAGKRGLQGLPGANGTNGKDGAPGDKGAKGDTGDTGLPGTSVTNTAIAANSANAHCKQGGAEFKVGSGTPTYACNGEPPKEIAKGETVTGAWNAIIEVGGGTEGYGNTFASFPAPFHSAPTHVEFVLSGTSVTGCPGTAAEPKAAEDYVCFYANTFTSGTSRASATASIYGATIVIEEPPARQLTGTWAATSG